MAIKIIDINRRLISFKNHYINYEVSFIMKFFLNVQNFIPFRLRYLIILHRKSLSLIIYTVETAYIQFK